MSAPTTDARLLDAACVLAGATRYTDAGITALRIVFRTNDAGDPDSWALITRLEDTLTAPTSLDEPVCYGYYDRADDDADPETGLIEQESRYFDTLRECFESLDVDVGANDGLDLGTPVVSFENEERAGYAQAGIEACATAQDRENEGADEERVIDLLTNLRHYCDWAGFDFAKLDRQAATHYCEEALGNG